MTTKVPAQAMAAPRAPPREDLFSEAIATYQMALARLARAYENDPDKQRDLLQELHLALWKSLANFDGRASLRTWVFRVAHNVACTYVLRERRRRAPGFVSLDELEPSPPSEDSETALDRRITVQRLFALIHQLGPLDRQIITLYLEGLDGATIAEITGLSPGNVNVKVHRIKKILAVSFGKENL
ncbi:MAG TPA: RNA polymerase sigma factor [Nannocystaceae bacterium]|nr:RNA polymerase sigma factor [Nannocystaceae bacterium]